jgi:CubicO group peptidase (beta-lactamase class C family)
MIGEFEDGPKRHVLGTLNNLDEFLQTTLAAWNSPGLAVAVVRDNELVYAKGHGYRHYGAKLPFTTRTVFPIGSNTKLFTAIVAGMLVEDGLLTWDLPIRESVPQIRFFDDALNNTITLRDMLAHRTGINRHDSMWFRSDLTRAELFDRLRHMAPSDPLRQSFVYNNVMYAAVGHAMELVSGESWESLVQRRLLDPIGMRNSVFTMAEAYRKPEYAVPYAEKRGSTELIELPQNEQMVAAGPAGGLNSDIEDSSAWLRTLINDGALNGLQIIPNAVLKATLAPSVAIPNHMRSIRGWDEFLNSTYGVGRHTAVYRGHLMTFHGGALGGLYSQVSYLPNEKLGVAAFVIGSHCDCLPNVLMFSLYDRLLGLEPAPWNERFLDIVKRNKQANLAARAKAAKHRVPDTRPSHRLPDYAGTFEHRLYPDVRIGFTGGTLTFGFRGFVLPLMHFHYDRFDTPDDEIRGKWSVNFSTDPQGEISALTVTLDEAEATFTRRAGAVPADVAASLTGVYETPGGFKCEVVHRKNRELYFVEPGQLDRRLIPYGALRFRSPSFSNVIYGFAMEDGKVTGMTITTEEGEYWLKRC